MIRLLTVLLTCVASLANAAVNVPAEMRQSNWSRQGSCLWAALVTDLRVVGQPQLATWIRQTKTGGATVIDLCVTLDRIKVGYSWHDSGSVSFLDTALRFGRPAIIQYNEDRSPHVVLLVHLDSRFAGIIDCNDTRNVIWIDRDKFVKHWQASWGWAVVLSAQPTH